jgi:hypothetical protein
MTLTRLTTDGLPRLDVRALARAGALRPGVTSMVSWGWGANISVHCPVDEPARVVLAYRAHLAHDHRQDVQETIPVRLTPCAFGGQRSWFVCPGCGTRCAVLYAYWGVVRCRGCHHLTYASTRCRRHHGTAGAQVGCR